jgi:hypothetical protein
MLFKANGVEDEMGFITLEGGINVTVELDPVFGVINS